MLNFTVENSPKINGHEMVEVHFQNIPNYIFIYEVIDPIVDSEYDIWSETDSGHCRALKYVNGVETDVASTDFLGGNRTNIGNETGYLPKEFSFRMPKFLLKKQFLETGCVYNPYGK